MRGGWREPSGCANVSLPSVGVVLRGAAAHHPHTDSESPPLPRRRIGESGKHHHPTTALGRDHINQIDLSFVCGERPRDGRAGAQPQNENM